MSLVPEATQMRTPKDHIIPEIPHLRAVSGFSTTVNHRRSRRVVGGACAS